MRLFYALHFSNEIKDQITRIQQGLSQHCPKCLFTRYENLHLTLCFLGEVERTSLPLLKEILYSVKGSPLTLQITTLGIFDKNQGGTLWLGIEENQELKDLQHQLALRLQSHAIYLDTRTFFAHITLARRAKGKKLPPLEPFTLETDKISLMHSYKKQNRLTYTPLYTLQLEQNTTL